MRRDLQEVDVNAHINVVNTCAEKESVLETIVQMGMECGLPLRFLRPWINPTFSLDDVKGPSLEETCRSFVS